MLHLKVKSGLNTNKFLDMNFLTMKIQITYYRKNSVSIQIYFNIQITAHTKIRIKIPQIKMTAHSR
jgi:hypothetical protein